jgi:hypothetical protein
MPMTIPSGQEAFIVDTGRAYLGYARDDLQGQQALCVYLDVQEAITDAVQANGFIMTGTVRVWHEAAMSIDLPVVVQFPGGAIHWVIGPESYEGDDDAILSDQP